MQKKIKELKYQVFKKRVRDLKEQHFFALSSPSSIVAQSYKALRLLLESGASKHRLIFIKIKPRLSIKECSLHLYYLFLTAECSNSLNLTC